MNARLVTAALLLLGCAGACTSGSGTTAPGSNGLENPGGYEPPGGGQEPAGGGQEPTGPGGYEPPGSNQSCLTCTTYTCSLGVQTISGSITISLTALSGGGGCSIDGSGGAQILCNGTVVSSGLLDDAGAEEAVSWARLGAGFTVTVPTGVLTSETLTCFPGGAASSSSSSSSGGTEFDGGFLQIDGG